MKRKMKWIGHMQSWKGIVKGYHMRLKGRRTETFHTKCWKKNLNITDEGPFPSLTFCLSPCLGCKVSRSSVVGLWPFAPVVRGVAKALVHDAKESLRLAPKLAATPTDVLALL